MRCRLLRRGDIVETGDGKLGVVSFAGAASVSADLIVRNPSLGSVSGHPSIFTFIPTTQIEKEYVLRRGLLNPADYK